MMQSFNHCVIQCSESVLFVVYNLNVVCGVEFQESYCSTLLIYFSLLLFAYTCERRRLGANNGERGKSNLMLLPNIAK